ncbi:hypothetical protein GW17_00031431, partial [Ensete ventricosum]
MVQTLRKEKRGMPAVATNSATSRASKTVLSFSQWLGTPASSSSSSSSSSSAMSSPRPLLFPVVRSRCLCTTRRCAP